MIIWIVGQILWIFYSRLNFHLILSWLLRVCYVLSLNFVTCFIVFLGMVRNLWLQILFTAVRSFNRDHVCKILSSLKTVLAVAILTVDNVWIQLSESSLVSTNFAIVLFICVILVRLLYILGNRSLNGWRLASILLFLSCWHALLHSTAFWTHILHIA